MGDKNVLTFPGRYEEVKHICEFVAAGAAASGLNEADIFHVELACDEACTNVIEHAYGGEGIGEIRVSWQVQNGMFQVKIEDDGRAFEPQDVPNPPIPPDPDDPDFSEEAIIEELKVGGLGIHFMRKLMDKVVFTFKEDGNTLIMAKKISKQL